MIALFCGSRDWTDEVAIVDGLDTAWQIARRDFGQEARATLKIIHGGAPGADMIAHQAATLMGFDVLPVHADWRRYGKVAGRIRNFKMLDLGPDYVFAFQRGASRGTQHTLSEAARRGIKIVSLYVDA